MGTAQLMEIPANMPPASYGGVSEAAVYHLDPPLRGVDLAIGFVYRSPAGSGFVLWRSGRNGSPRVDPECSGVGALTVERFFGVTDALTAFSRLGYEVVR